MELERDDCAAIWFEKMVTVDAAADQPGHLSRRAERGAAGVYSECRINFRRGAAKV